MLLKDYIKDIGGVDGICDIYLNGITKKKFNERFESNKDLVIYSFKKLNASGSFIEKLENIKSYDELIDILTKVKGGKIKWN